MHLKHFLFPFLFVFLDHSSPNLVSRVTITDKQHLLCSSNKSNMADSFSALTQQFVEQRKKDAALRREKRKAKKERKAKEKAEMEPRGYDKQWVS